MTSNLNKFGQICVCAPLMLQKTRPFFQTHLPTGKMSTKRIADTKVDTEILHRAVLSLAAAQCYEMGECVQAMNKYEMHIQAIDNPKTMATWLPNPCVAVQVGKLPCGRSIILIEDSIYYTSELSSLPCNISTSVIFMAHYTEDSVNGKLQARLLVYDMYDIDQPSMPYVQRYHLLRTQYGAVLGNALYTIQWVGYKTAAEKLLLDTKIIPHGVSGIVCIPDTPRRLVRPLPSLKIPHTVIQKFRCSDQPPTHNTQPQCPVNTTATLPGGTVNTGNKRKRL